MRKVRSIKLAVAIACLLIGTGTLQADVLGYWRFESPTAISDAVYDWSWMDYSGRSHAALSTDDCSGSASIFSTSVPATHNVNAGSMAFPNWYSRTDWASVADHADFDFGADESFTIETWVNFGTYSDNNDHEILQDGYYSTTPGWGVSYEADNKGIKFYLVDSSGIYLDARSDGALNDGLWHHIAGVREVTSPDGESLRLYVDGVLQTGDTTLTAAVARDLSNSDELWIGGADSPYCYGGYLDELRISSGALAPSEFLNVPEPATLSLLGLGSIAMFRRRRATGGLKA